MSAKRKAVESEPLALAIVVEGKIIESNFPAFREEAERQIEAISFDLVTDEDFDRADSDAKGLKRFEEMLATTKADFLKQMDEVNALLESVDGLSQLSRKTRLEIEKRVASRKAEIREGIVRDGLAALDITCREFSERIQEAIKGKKSLAKMQEAVTEVVEAINAAIGSNRITLEMARADHGEAISYSETAFLCMPPDAAKTEMERRIERHRAALKEAAQQAEIERLRKEAEEKAESERQQSIAEQVVTNVERASEQPAAPQQAPTGQPAPVVQSPVGQTAAEEMAAFIETLKASFAPVKAARANLKHPANIKAAEQFALTLGVAFGELQSA